MITKERFLRKIKIFREDESATNEKWKTNEE